MSDGWGYGVPGLAGSDGFTPPGEMSPDYWSLEVHDEDLVPLRDSARSLRLGMSRAIGQAGETYSAVEDLKSAGLSAGPAMHAAMRRFFSRTMSLSADCQRIEEHLGQTLVSHEEMEQATVAGLRQVKDGVSRVAGMWPSTPSGGAGDVPPVAPGPAAGDKGPLWYF